MEIKNYMDEYRKELERKFFRPRTIDNYVSYIGSFLQYFDEKKTHPIKINESILRNICGNFQNRIRKERIILQ